MTIKQMYEALLIECNKVNAPSFDLEAFNYFVNKSIQSFVNKNYNINEVDQVRVDNLRVLKTSTYLTPVKAPTDLAKQLVGGGKGAAEVTTQNSIYGATYEFNLPADYLHLLNCVCVFKVNKTNRCYNVGDTINIGATRLTSDIYPIVINNLYMRPSYKHPYYYINNLNQSTTNPTNGWEEYNKGSTKTSIVIRGVDNPKDLEIRPNYEGNHDSIVDEPNSVNYPNYPRYITIGSSNHSTVNKEAGYRYGNTTNVRLEIRYGKDSSTFTLQGVLVDYIKAPQYIRFTQEQLDLTDDTSQILEWPDYVCQEIINELTAIVMENSADQRLQTHVAISQSIAPPAQAQAQTK